MLYIAEYDQTAPVILDAANDEHAIAMLDAHGLDRPSRLHEVQPGTFIAEMFTADDGRAEYPADVIPNPANHSQTGFAFEPFEATAQWFENWTAANAPSAESSPDATAEEQC